MQGSLVTICIFFPVILFVKMQKPTAAKVSEIKVHLTGCPPKFQVKAITIQKGSKQDSLSVNIEQMNVSNRYIRK